VVPASTFYGDQQKEAKEPACRDDQKAIVLEALANQSKWHRLIRDLACGNHHIKVNCTSSGDGGLIAAHFVSHNDFKLIQLARRCGFPRGCCFIADLKARRLVGQGTFYPKFANDDRNAGFSSQDFGTVTRISCFIKYSGSTGIITIVRDLNGNVVGWTGSSKNSCNHASRDDGMSYPLETVAAFSKYVTGDFLKWCQKRCITSLGLEVMIDRDQTHGYGYTKSGCIVTAICAEGHTDGRPIYLSPQEVYQSCQEVGLPTDRPILVEGMPSIQAFVESISDIRDVLTLSALRHFLRMQGVELETIHEEVIDSQIIEGFVIRRWREDEEIESVKFKIWLYQMVTQVLRPSLSGKFSSTAAVPSLKGADGRLRSDFLQLARGQMKKWCVVPQPCTQALCRWVIYAAGEACLPARHPQLEWSGGNEFPSEAAAPNDCVARDPKRAYWITLGDHAVKRLISLLDAAEWNLVKVADGLPQSAVWAASATDEEKYADADAGTESLAAANSTKGAGKNKKGNGKDKKKGGR